MTLHYTVNTFSTAKDVVDVTQLGAAEEFAPMGLAVRVPDGVSIRGKPKTLTELLDSKKQGILEAYSGYASVLMDPCLSVTATATSPGVNTSASYGYMPGSGFSNHLLLSSTTGMITTQQYTLTATAPPASFVVLWEAYTISTVEVNGQYFRRYLQRDPSVLDCTISFDGDTVSAYSGAVVNILDPSKRGYDVVLRFENVSLYDIYLGSWALVYGAPRNPNEAP